MQRILCTDTSILCTDTSVDLMHNLSFIFLFFGLSNAVMSLYIYLHRLTECSWRCSGSFKKRHVGSPDIAEQYHGIDSVSLYCNHAMLIGSNADDRVSFRTELCYSRHIPGGLHSEVILLTGVLPRRILNERTVNTILQPREHPDQHKAIIPPQSRVRVCSGQPRELLLVHRVKSILFLVPVVLVDLRPDSYVLVLWCTCVHVTVAGCVLSWNGGCRRNR